LHQCKRKCLHRANSDPINLGPQDGRYRRITWEVQAIAFRLAFEAASRDDAAN
jgi:hypothetical protein